MAKFTIKSGKRGRPLTIDTDKLLNEYYSRSKAALSNLAQIRKESSGVRDPGLVGTTTSAPNWWKTTVQILKEAEKGKLSYDAGKFLKENVRTISKLGSKRESTREEALSDVFFKDYLEELNEQLRTGSKASKKWLEATKERIAKMNKRQRQQFFTSRHYESPKAFNRHRYEKVRAWARKQTGNREISHSEAQAYLLYRRATDGLSVTDEQKAAFGGVSIEDIF